MWECEGLEMGKRKDKPLFLSLWPSKYAWKVFQRAIPVHAGAAVEAVAEGEK